MQSPTSTSPAPVTSASHDANPRSMPFRLMDLPTEVRVAIYAELVVVGKVHYTPQRYDELNGRRFREPERYRKPELSILRVSKQVRDEAEDLYLSR